MDSIFHVIEKNYFDLLVGTKSAGHLIQLNSRMSSNFYVSVTHGMVVIFCVEKMKRQFWNTVFYEFRDEIMKPSAKVKIKY